MKKVFETWSMALPELHESATKELRYAHATKAEGKILVVLHATNMSKAVQRERLSTAVAEVEQHNVSDLVMPTLLTAATKFLTS